MQNDRDHRCFQRLAALDGQINRLGSFSLDPVAQAAQRAVGGERRANAGAKRVEGGITVSALDHRLDLGAVLVMVSQRRERRLRLPRFTIAQDQKTPGRYTLGQHLAAQDGGGQRREPRVQRGEDGFAGGGNGITR